MKVLLILHGRSRPRGLTRRTWHSLALAEGFELEIMETEGPGHAKEIAQTAHEKDLVVACGGDGTNHEVVNGLMHLEVDVRPAFASIPGGSGNDFARLRSVKSASEVLHDFSGGNTTEIAVIEFVLRGETQYALNVSTGGIGAEIAQQVNRRKYNVPPAMNYYTAILQWLAKYKAPGVKVHADGQVISSASNPFLLAVGNGKYAGNGLGLCPQANLVDDNLALTVIGNVGVLDFLRYQTILKRCEEVEDPRVSYRTAMEINIEVKRGLFSIEADGEFMASLETGEQISYKKVRNALRLV